MKSIVPSLVVYFTAVFLVLLSIIIDNETLELLSRPVVLPALLYYYFSRSNHRIKELFVVCILFCFLGEIIILLYNNTKFVWEIFVFFCSYLILIKSGLDTINFKKILFQNLVISIVVLFLLCFLLFSILDLINEIHIDMYLMYLFFGLILVTLFCVSLLNYFTRPTTSSLYFAAMALCILLSDVFFSFYQFIDKMLVFKCINVFFQLISYYFMVCYFIERNPKLK
jgi:hypothetical protein